MRMQPAPVAKGGGGWRSPLGAVRLEELLGSHRAPAELKLSPRRGGENLFHLGCFPISLPLHGMRLGGEAEEG